jgi:hypothetical protein
MVLHVLADAAQVMDDRDADAPEMLGIANPRQLQDVRRADRPADGVTSCIASPLSRAPAGTAARELDGVAGATQFARG